MLDALAWVVLIGLGLVVVGMFLNWLFEDFSEHLTVVGMILGWWAVGAAAFWACTRLFA